MKKHPNLPDPTKLRLVPEPIRGKVGEYIGKASDLVIDPSRVLVCACLLATAERDPNCHLPQGPTLSTLPYQIIGALFGLSGEDCDPEIVIPLYRKARKAMQRANQSANAALRQIQKLDRIMRDNHKALPEHLKGFRSRIREVNEPIVELILWTGGDNLLDRKRPKAATEIFNVSQLAFVWWRICLGGKHTPWEDMFKLARIWRLTDSRDIANFRRQVVRLSKRATGIWPPPAWCLKLCHS
jgi:hypothetical protein